MIPLPERHRLNVLDPLDLLLYAFLQALVFIGGGSLDLRQVLIEILVDPLHLLVALNLLAKELIIPSFLLD